jgi:hypothetical protein
LEEILKKVIIALSTLISVTAFARDYSCEATLKLGQMVQKTELNLSSGEFRNIQMATIRFEVISKLQSDDSESITLSIFHVFEPGQEGTKTTLVPKEEMSSNFKTRLDVNLYDGFGVIDCKLKTGLLRGSASSFSSDSRPKRGDLIQVKLNQNTYFAEIHSHNILSHSVSLSNVFSLGEELSMKRAAGDNVQGTPLLAPDMNYHGLVELDYYKSIVSEQKKVCKIFFGEDSEVKYYSPFESWGEYGTNPYRAGTLPIKRLTCKNSKFYAEDVKMQ